jgi:pilus assembly protein CpaF
MSLAARVDRVSHHAAPATDYGAPTHGEPDGPADPSTDHVTGGETGGDTTIGTAGRVPPEARRAFVEILDEVRDAVRAVSRSGEVDGSRAQRTVEREVDAALARRTGTLDRSTPIPLRNAVVDEILGFGPIQDLLDRPDVSEIMVNGPDRIFVERSGRLELTDRRFDSPEHLLAVIDRMVRSSGRRVDQSSPMVDARLPDGSRLNVVLPPLAVDGASVTVRKFTAQHLTSADLVRHGALTAEAAEVIRRAVTGRMNIIVSGGTGTGKTTMLNILSSNIGRTERVITVEDAVELQLDSVNLIRLEARPANTEGAGAVTIRDLVRNSLRMRPDRIVVGEVRGAEALDMLQAMNTGHDGSLSTLHANTPRDALRRLETMVLLGGVELPLRAIREQIASAIDLIIQLQRDASGRRVVSSISEVVGLEGDVITTTDLFVRADPVDGRPGELVATGVPSRRLGSVVVP